LNNNILSPAREKEAVAKPPFTFHGEIAAETKVTRSVMIVTEGDGALEV
jgi:hypothetical protein